MCNARPLERSLCLTLSLSLLLAVSLFAASAAADVGFRLPRGALSRANTARGYVIRQDALPWGADGNTAQADFAKLAALRYGGELAGGTRAPDVSGLHASDYEAALIMIATKDPEWCRSVGGSACHPGQPTEQESHDAQYWSYGSRVIQRARELGFGGQPTTEGQKIPGRLSGPDLGEPGQPLAFGVEGCDPFRPWRWSAPGGFVRGRGNAVTVTFPKAGVYTVSALGSGGCGDAAMMVTIGDVSTPPPPPPPPPDKEPPAPPPLSDDLEKRLEELWRLLKPLLREWYKPAVASTGRSRVSVFAEGGDANQ